MGGIMVKLPVFDVLGRAFTAPARYGWPLLPYFFGVAVITIGLGLGVFNNFPTGVATADGSSSAATENTGGYAGLFIASLVILILLFSSFAALVHRQAAGVPDKWKLGWPTLRYIGVSLLMGILTTIVGAIVLLIAGILGGGPAVMLAFASGEWGGGTSLFAMIAIFLATVTIYAFYARISLALPATAVGEAGSISLAWQISRGNTLRLLAAWILYFILVVVLEMVVSFLIGGANVFSGEGTTLMAVFGTIVTVVFLYYYVVFGIAFLTYSYLALAPNKDNSAGVSASPADHPSGPTDAAS